MSDLLVVITIHHLSLLEVIRNVEEGIILEQQMPVQMSDLLGDLSRCDSRDEGNGDCHRRNYSLGKRCIPVPFPVLQHTLPRKIICQILRLAITGEKVLVNWKKKENPRQPSHQPRPAMHGHHAYGVVHPKSVHAEGPDEVPREGADDSANGSNHRGLPRFRYQIRDRSNGHSSGNTRSLGVENSQFQVPVEYRGGSQSGY
mmetsp:Transcript_38117/g.59449  ORF Transcript_38117/g.59449 Transcript_38117/m.59449 type:complete len:201 (-) Transcript_38117:523-1125(-)